MGGARQGAICRAVSPADVSSVRRCYDMLRLKALTGVSARVAVLAPGSLPRATHKAKRVEDRRTDLWT